MADRRKYGRDEKDRDGDVKPKLDEPPNSRLFIVCNKNITEEEFRSAFEKYGTIEEIWVVRDRNTGDPKGNQVAHKTAARSVYRYVHFFGLGTTANICFRCYLHQVFKDVRSRPCTGRNEWLLYRFASKTFESHDCT
jgi:hypothetical protein